MRIFVAADHNGFYLRNVLIKYLDKAGYDVCIEGDKKLDPQDDFPVLAQAVVNDMLSSDDDEPRGILICGSGQGMCMAANRFNGIRAVLGYDRDAVLSARNDDDANVLCLPAETLEKDETYVIVETFLNTPFAKAARFIRRIHELDNLR